MKLNQSLVNAAVENNQTQGGINMNNVNNNEQLQVAFQEMKKDVLARMDAFEAMLFAQPVPELVVEESTPEEEEAIFEQIANMSAPVSNQPVINVPKEQIGGFGLVENATPYVTEEVEEIDIDSIQFPTVEKPLDLTHDEEQKRLIAEALDFLDNPEAHEDAVLVTEDTEEEAPAPADDELVDNVTQSMKEALQRMNNMEPLPTLEEELDNDEDDIDLDLSDETEENPFDNIHIPTKKEKREQTAALEQAFGLSLNMDLVKKPVEEPVKEPVVDVPVTRPVSGGACVISGPIDQALLFNSGRISHKNGSKGFSANLSHYMYRGVKTHCENGVREFHVCEFNGIELFIPLFWMKIKAEFPDVKLILFTNDKSYFQQYKQSIEDEEAAGVYSPKRLSLMIRYLADEVVKVEGNAFSVRKASVENVSAYIRIIPKDHQDGANRFMGKDQHGLEICPWSLDVFKTGAFEQKFIPGPGVNYAPKAYQKPVATV